MKTETHPTYLETSVRCTCGNAFTTRSTRGGELRVELCDLFECVHRTAGQRFGGVVGVSVRFGDRIERTARRVDQCLAVREFPVLGL
jgi:large subunit ribosomal protein L31